MKNSAALLSAFLIVLMSVLGAVSVHAQDFTITNGYVCDPKNPGGEETRLYYREQDGLAINISPSATFPIVCPVQIPYDNPPYEVSVGFRNTSSSSQKFSCALEENDLYGSKTRSQGQSVTVPALGWGALNWSDILLINKQHYLSIRCILPPKGAATWIEWY